MKGWRGGGLSQLQAAEQGEVRMDATAQARATSDRLPGFEGGAEDRTGFLLHRSTMAGGLNAQLCFGAFVEVPNRERGH